MPLVKLLEFVKFNTPEPLVSTTFNDVPDVDRDVAQVTYWLYKSTEYCWPEELTNQDE